MVLSKHTKFITITKKCNSVEKYKVPILRQLELKILHILEQFNLKTKNK